MCERGGHVWGGLKYDSIFTCAAAVDPLSPS